MSFRQHPAPATGPPVWTDLDARTGRSPVVILRMSTKDRSSMKWKSRQFSVISVRPVASASAAMSASAASGGSSWCTNRSNRSSARSRMSSVSSTTVTPSMSANHVARRSSYRVRASSRRTVSLTARSVLPTYAVSDRPRLFARTTAVVSRRTGRSVSGPQPCRPLASSPRRIRGRSCGCHQLGHSSRGARVPFQRSERRPR